MGYVLLQYLIFTCSEAKPLELLRKRAIKAFLKEEDLKRYVNCVGIVGGGMNGNYSLVIVPHGWNGGWHSYSTTFDEIKDAMYDLNHKERLRYANSKKQYDSAAEIDLKILSEGDDGLKIELEDIFSRLRDGINPTIGWVVDGRFEKEVEAVDEERFKIFEKQGQDEAKSKKKKGSSNESK